MCNVMCNVSKQSCLVFICVVVVQLLQNAALLVKSIQHPPCLLTFLLGAKIKYGIDNL